MLILGYGPMWEPIAWIISDVQRSEILRRRLIEQWEVRVFSEAV